MPRTSTSSRPGRQVAAPAPATSSAPADPIGDRWFIIPGMSWQGYVSISDAVIDPPNLRMIYCDGRLTFLTESRKHGWYAERLAQLVVALAGGLAIPWEDAASATFRRAEKSGGVEGDKTFYFGAHAERMKGAQDIDLDVQPPPDLAVEVEVSHSADDAVIVWGRLGVPEVWRFDPIAGECGFWVRRRGGTYVRRDRSLAFPVLTAADVLEQMRLADGLGAGAWHARLGRWVRKAIVPRSRARG